MRTTETLKNIFHFARQDDQGRLTLRYGDGREIKEGETLTVNGEPHLCYHGLHASYHVAEALCYATDPSQLCLVNVGGDVITGEDKVVGTWRTAVKILSLEQTASLLHAITFLVAKRAAPLYSKTPILGMLQTYLNTGGKSRDLRAAAHEQLRQYIYPQDSQLDYYAHYALNHALISPNPDIMTTNLAVGYLQDAINEKRLQDHGYLDTVIRSHPLPPDFMTELDDLAYAALGVPREQKA